MSLYLIPGPEKIQWHRTLQSTHFECTDLGQYISNNTCLLITTKTNDHQIISLKALGHPYLQIPLYIFGNPSFFGTCLCLYADKSAHSKNIIHSLCLPFLWLMPVQTSPPHHLLSHKYHFLVKLVHQHYTERIACTKHKKIFNLLKKIFKLYVPPPRRLWRWQSCTFWTSQKEVLPSSQKRVVPLRPSQSPAGIRNKRIHLV